MRVYRLGLDEFPQKTKNTTPCLDRRCACNKSYPRPQMKSIPSIRSSLSLLVAACLFPVALASAGLLFYGYWQSKDQMLDDARAAAETASSLVDTHFSNVAATLHALATSPSLTRHDLAAFYEQAKQVLPTQNVANIVLTDRQGQQVLNTLRPFGSELPENGSRIRTQHFGDSNEPLISDLFYGQVANRPVIAIAVPVRREGEVIYGLSTGMSPQPFVNLLARLNLPPNWVTAVVDSEGKVVARSHDMQKHVGQTVSRSLIQAWNDRDEGHVSGEADDGDASLSVYKRSPASGWSVIISIPPHSLEQELRKTMAALGLAIVLLFAFSLTMARRLGTRITHAIRSLTGPAIALGEGGKVEVPPLQLAEADEVGKALVRASEMLELARYQATHDMLTGMGNRTLFHEILSQQLTLAVRNATPLSVLFIDLDGFKPVNDTYGHAAGDKLLCHVAARLRIALRGSDFAARLGGDEFAVILVGADENSATRVAEKILRSLTVPCLLDGRDISVSASIGIASYPQSGKDIRELLHAADEAMYRAKAAGKNQVIVATPAASPAAA